MLFSPELSKLRKEKDEHSIAELRVSMSNMDRSLSHEIKRRIEATANLERICTEKIAAMEDRLNTIIDEKVKLIQDKLSNMEKKIEELNARLEEERVNVPLDIERRGKELRTMLQDFQEEFSVERRDRLNREGRIMKQLSDHADLVAKQWTLEREERQKSVAELRMKLEDTEKNRLEADASFETLIDRELKLLKKEIVTETKERKMEDDEIVAALNRYTDHLQRSLSVISSVDH